MFTPFQCEPQFGLFCKVGRLCRLPETQGDASSLENSYILQANGRYSASSADVSPLAEKDVDVTLDAGASSTPPPPSGADKQLLELGDRVIVSGNKVGRLRYLGPTEFGAQGMLWAGVELDQPLGKNDGSVQGKRYFACKPRYGVFVPASKALKAPHSSSTPLTGGKLMLIRHTKTSALRRNQRLGGSQESLSSTSSFISTTSSRLAQPMQRARRLSSLGPTNKLAPSAVTSLQDSVREKDEHIEKLLQERDIERAEMVVLAQNLEQSEAKLAVLEAMQAKNGDTAALQAKFVDLKAELEAANRAKYELSSAVDEEKKKTDDLLFRIEEESILKAELEAKISDLEAVKGEDAASAPDDGEERKLRRTLDLLHGEKSAWQKEEVNLRRIMLEQNQKLEQFKKKNLDLEKQMQRNMAEMSEQNSMVSNFEKQLAEEQSLLSSRDAQIEELKLKDEEEKQQLLKVQTNVAMLLQHKIDLEGRLAEADMQQRKALEAKQREVVYLTSKLDALTLELSGLRSSKSETEEKTLAAVRRQLTEKDDELSKERELGKNRQQELENCKSRIVLMENNLKAEDSATAEKLGRLEAELLAGKTEIQEKNAYVGKLSAELMAGKEECETLKLEKDSMSKKFAEEFEQLKNKALELESIKLEFDKVNRNLQSNESIFEKEKAALSAKLTESRDLATGLQEKLDRSLEGQNELEKRLIDNSGATVEHANLLEQKRAEITQLSTKLDKLQFELNSSRQIADEQKLGFEMRCSQLASELEQRNLELKNTRTALLKAEHVEKSRCEQEIQLKTQLDSASQRQQQIEQELANTNEQVRNSKLDADRVKLEKDMISAEIATVKTQNAQLEAQLAEATSTFESEKVDLLAKIVDLENNLKNEADKAANTSSQSAKLEAENSSLKSELEIVNSRLKEKTEQSEAEQQKAKNALVAQKGELEQQLLEKSVLLDEKSQTLAQKEKQLAELTANLKKTNDDVLLTKTSLQEQTSNLEKKLAENHNGMESLKLEIGRKSSELEVLKKSTDEKDSATRELQNRVNEQDDEMVKLKNLLAKSQTRCEELQSMCSSLNAQVKQLKDSLEIKQKAAETGQNEQTLDLTKKVAVFEKENAQLTTGKVSFEKKIAELEKAVTQNKTEKEKILLESEKKSIELRVLTDELSKIQSVSVPTNGNDTSKKSNSSQIVEYEQQIDFLNSVIVEQKKKSEKLKAKIEVLQRLPDEMLSLTEKEERKKKRKKRRLYCDICEQFDVHETEDCPTQTMDVADVFENTSRSCHSYPENQVDDAVERRREKTTHSHHEGKRGEHRPYCEHCEVFGHATESCAETETY